MTKLTKLFTKAKIKWIVTGVVLSVMVLISPSLFIAAAAGSLTTYFWKLIPDVTVKDVKDSFDK